MTSTLEWLKSQPHEGKFETVSDALNYQHAISILGPDEYLLYLHWVIEQKQAEIEKLRAAPKVKALEWHKSHINGWNGDWHTVPTAYTVRCADENGWKWTGQSGFGYCHSDTEAKAAAQADFERRILEALE